MTMPLNHTEQYGFDIDCHIITTAGTNPLWLQETLDSLKGQPCNVHIVEGVLGNISIGRQRGWQAGTAKYQTFVDDDDWVYPGAMRHLLKEMSTGVPAVVTLENEVHEGNVLSVRKGHHLWCIRRDVMAKYAKDYALRVSRMGGNIPCTHILGLIQKPVQTDFIGYAWRKHPAQHHLKHGDGAVHRHGWWCTKLD